MSQFATVSGTVTFTPGDGAPIKIPEGRIEVELAARRCCTGNRVVRGSKLTDY